MFSGSDAKPGCVSPQAAALHRGRVLDQGDRVRVINARRRASLAPGRGSRLARPRRWAGLPHALSLARGRVARCYFVAHSAASTARWVSGSVMPAAVRIAAEVRSSVSTVVKTVSRLTWGFRVARSPATPPRHPEVVRNDAAANLGAGLISAPTRRRRGA